MYTYDTTGNHVIVNQVEFQGFYSHCQECYRAPGWTKQAERLISALRGRTNIQRRQMSTQLNTAKKKPSPLKFQAAPSPQAKSEELSTFLKVVLGVSCQKSLIGRVETPKTE